MVDEYFVSGLVNFTEFARNRTIATPLLCASIRFFHSNSIEFRLKELLVRGYTNDTKKVRNKKYVQIKLLN